MIDVTLDDDGDVNYPAALMLAQVTFWCDRDGRSGRPRSDHEHGAHRWLVRADDEWIAELGMPRKTARKARLRLVALGLIEAVTLVDDGVRCTHLRRLYPDGADLDEPSTIVPESEHADPRPSSGSGTEHVPDQALSHAGASSTSLETKEETSADKPPLRERDPQLAHAVDIVQAYWDYCHANDLPRPTLSHTSGNVFMAVAKIIRGFLDAGYPEAAIKRGMIETKGWTVNMLTIAIRDVLDRQHRDEGPNPHLVRYDR